MSIIVQDSNNNIIESLLIDSCSSLFEMVNKLLSIIKKYDNSFNIYNYTLLDKVLQDNQYICNNGIKITLI